jgi:hypothetical protein
MATAEAMAMAGEKAAVAAMVTVMDTDEPPIHAHFIHGRLTSTECPGAAPLSVASNSLRNLPPTENFETPFAPCVRRR